MDWKDIKTQYPDKFILLGDLVEEHISDNQFRILGGSVLEIRDSVSEIRALYKKYKANGK